MRPQENIIIRLWYVAILIGSSAVGVVPAGAQQDSYNSLYDGSFAERATLTGNWGGVRDDLAAKGITFLPSITQFYQGPTAGNTTHRFDYGGKAEAFLTIEGSKVGLWNGFSIQVHGEYNFGKTPGAVGGTTLPNNTAMAFPDENVANGDLTSVFVTQRFGEFSISAGKINMFDAYAAGAEFSGGRGIEKFQHVAFVGPPTGTVPVSMFGAIATLKIDPFTFTFMAYDPREALNRSGFENPFVDGITFRGSIDFRSNPFGLRRRDSVTVAVSNEKATDLSAVGDNLRLVLGATPTLTGEGISELRKRLIQGLLTRALWGGQGGRIYLPVGFMLPGFQEPLALPEKRDWYHVAYSFEQTLWQSPNDSKKAWGLFGQIGISDGNPNAFKWEGLIGIGGSSPIPGRSDDRFGVGMFYYGYSDYLKPTQGLSPLLNVGDEYGGEIFYNIAVTNWLRLTADLQLIAPAIKSYAVAFPLTNPILEHNWPIVLFGLRAQVVF